MSSSETILDSQASQAASYFAQMNTRRLAPLREDPDLTDYFRFIYAIIMLGYKEKDPTISATGDMRNKSPYSTELKFLENLSSKKGRIY